MADVTLSAPWEKSCKHHSAVVSVSLWPYNVDSSLPHWNLGALNVRKLTFHCSLWLLPQRERSSHTWNKALLFFISKEFSL